MSEEMAVNDIAAGEKSEENTEEGLEAAALETSEAAPEAPAEAPAEEPEALEPEIKQEIEELPEVKEEPEEKDDETKLDIKEELPEEASMDEDPDEDIPVTEKRGVKRRASSALSDIDESEEFKGFDGVDQSSLAEYNKAVERLEAEVTEAVKTLTPLRSVRASSTTSVRSSKRPRQDTDGSRPSSALSMRSDGDGAISTDASMSPAGASGGRGRRSTVEMSSPLLRVPLERGWRRELVYRAALDAHSRRNADIYYYTPAGKKLRSTREVAEQLSGTGLTLENFSFFKEPLGIDDPEKEIIRDAKVMRRVESPVPPAAPPEGKRTPKPKPPKGASPEPATPKSPPAKLKVKSVGSRLSSNSPASAVTPKQLRKPQPQPPAPAPATPPPAAAAPAPDNNNTTAWKKPRAAPPQLPRAAPAPDTRAQEPSPPVHPAQPVQPVQQVQPAPVQQMQQMQQLQQLQQLQPVPPLLPLQPCSLTCGRGVPSLACAACLCLYHPTCVGLTHPLAREAFYCKNCRKSTSPPPEPPPHKSGMAPLAPSAGGAPGVAPRRLPVPVPVPVPVPAKGARGDKRVLLRMKVAGGGPDGSRVWAVTKGPGGSAPGAPPPAAPAPSPAAAPPAPPPTSAPRPSLPQSLAVLNGRRFIVVPRALVQPAQI